MSDSTVSFDRSSGRFVEDKQPQIHDLNQTSRGWYVEEIKYLQEQLRNTQDKETFKDLFIRLCQTKKEFITEYPR